MQQDGTFPTYQLISVSRNDNFVTMVLASADVNANPSGVGDRGQEATTPSRYVYTLFIIYKSLQTNVHLQYSIYRLGMSIRSSVP